jgi:hypothetical protein
VCALQYSAGLSAGRPYGRFTSETRLILVFIEGRKKTWLRQQELKPLMVKQLAMIGGISVCADIPKRRRPHADLGFPEIAFQ